MILQESKKEIDSFITTINNVESTLKIHKLQSLQ